MSFNPAVVASGNFTSEVTATLRKVDLYAGDDPAHGGPFLVVLGYVPAHCSRQLADLIGIREDDPAASVADGEAILENFQEISDLLENDPTLAQLMRDLADEGVSFGLLE